jgi:hypothetical protein
MLLLFCDIFVVLLLQIFFLADWQHLFPTLLVDKRFTVELVKKHFLLSTSLTLASCLKWRVAFSSDLFLVMLFVAASFHDSLNK